MSQGPKLNKNYLYPYVADQPSPSSNPPKSYTYPASSPTANAPAPRYSQKFPYPTMNRRSSSACLPTYAAYSTSTSNVSAPQYNQSFPRLSLNLQRSSAYSPSSTSSDYAYASASADNAAAEYFLPATTYSSPAQTTHHHTCPQPSLPSSPTPFDRRPTHIWPPQLRYDVTVRSTAQDTKRDSGSSRDREVSGRINRSNSFARSPASTSVGSSSRNKGRPRVNGLYVIDYDRSERRSRVSKETHKKEIADRQAVARQSPGRLTAESPTAESPTADEEERKRNTPEDWKAWQTEGGDGGWM